MPKEPNLDDDVISPRTGPVVPRNSELQTVFDRAAKKPCTANGGMHTWEDRRDLGESTEPYSCQKCPAFLDKADLEKIRGEGEPASSAIVDEAKARAGGQLKAAHYQADKAVVYKGKGKGGGDVEGE